MKSILVAALVAISPQTHVHKVKNLCSRIFSIPFDPLPYAEFTPEMLLMESETNKSDALKKEIIYRLDRIIQTDENKQILLTAFFNIEVAKYE